jgi:hypothetical protein
MPATSQRIRTKAAVALATLVAASLVWSGGTFSSFDRTSAMPGNSVGTGTVKLADNDNGTALLTAPGLKPGDSVTGCVLVSYSGTAPAQVRLLATTGGTGLASSLNLTVTRGTFTGTPAAGSCTGFTADTTAWSASGAGVIYTGTLASFPSSSTNALADPNASSTATWSSGDKHAYKLVLTLPSGVASSAQGLTASASFTWQAVSQ